jgi:putative transposase
MGPSENEGIHEDEVWKKYIEDQKPEEPDDNFKVV